MKYRKKPVVIEAVRITHAWFDAPHPNPLHPVGLMMNPLTRTVEVKTLEGVMTAEIGDWIITGIKGERYPCKPDIFAATYEPVYGEDHMLGQFEAKNHLDDKEFSDGGYVKGMGLQINWQDGPLGHDNTRLAPNGAFVETVIAAAKQRIEFYQEAHNGKFKCRENAIAITKLTEALFWLNKRTQDRENRNVEGTTAT